MLKKEQQPGPAALSRFWLHLDSKILHCLYFLLTRMVFKTQKNGIHGIRVSIHTWHTATHTHTHTDTPVEERR